MSNYVIWFKDLNKESINVAGGKGANLAEMVNIGLPVPGGFCISAQTYKEYIETTGLKAKIMQLLGTINVEDTEQLQRVAEQVQKLFTTVPLPEEMAEEIMENYELLGANKKEAASLLSGEEVFVAVRSSATAEDLPSISEEEHVLVTVDGKPLYKKMKELEWLNPEKQRVEIPALENNQIKWKKISAVYKHPTREEKLYKIKTVSGREVTISPDHSLIILDEDTLQPKTAKIKDLKGNEKVPAISILPLINSPDKALNVLDYVRGKDVVEKEGKIYISNNSGNWGIQHPLSSCLNYSANFAYFLGVYAAEGSTYKRNQVLITNSEADIQKRIIGFLQQLNLYKEQKINKHTIRVCCKSLVRLLHAIAGEPSTIRGKGKLSTVKKVPDFVFGWDKVLIGTFLRGAFDGDGGIESNGIGYSSTSPLLIGGLIKLLEMLGIEFSVRLKKSRNKRWHDSQTILIPTREAHKFKELIGFESKRKSLLLDNLINKHLAKEYHPEFKHTISISAELSHDIKWEYDTKINQDELLKYYCSHCNQAISQSSSYKEKVRFYCPTCNKTYYLGEIIQRKEKGYKYYDEKGRFQKEMSPWNKGIITGTASQKQFTEKMKELGLHFQDFFNGSVRWDQIKNIEEVSYKGFVYDFTVPEVENFAAGVGGIITHNSASFAGQQATFLNVKGKKQVIEAVRGCWASLFTARAIYYRVKNNFEHEKVLICAVVQKMVNSEQSGIMFTINPATNQENEIVIEGIYGLGEMVVGGEVNPDLYIVEKDTRKIKKMEIKKQEVGMFRNSLGENERRKIPENLQERQKINEKQIIELARLGKKIEEHYGRPQDIEWAIEKGEVYIVQARAVTTFKAQTSGERPGIQEEVGKIILKGETASAGVASGQVRIVRTMDDLAKVQKGDILVTRMTTPDEVPAMQKAAAIITDEGGMTCFSGDTKILTTNGFLTMEQAHTQLQSGSILKVLSFNPTSLKMEWKGATNPQRRQARLLEVAVSQTGRSKQNILRLTPDHKMVTLENRKVVERKVQDIQLNQEMVCVADYLPPYQNPHVIDEPDKAYLCGALFTDGYINSKPTKGSVTFIQKEIPEKQEFINSVKNRFSSVFGTGMDYTRVRTTSGNIIRGGEVNGSTSDFICFKKKPAEELNAVKENMVDWVLHLNKVSLHNFLAGVIDGDGSFNVTHDSGRINIYASKEYLAQGVILACLRLGILPQVSKNRRSCYNIQIVDNIPELLSYTTRVKGNIKEKVLGTKLFGAKAILGDIVDSVNFKGRIKPYLTSNLLLDARKIRNSVLPLIKDSHLRQEMENIINADFRMQRLSQISELEKGEVYNFEVEDTHTYVVFTDNYTPVIVWNCHAAIVSREMGTPCLVGTEHATEVLKDGEVVTVHASRGVVYEGKVNVQPELKPAIVAASVYGEEIVTATEIKVILDLPDLAGHAAATGADGVGLVRLEIMIANGGIHPAEYVRLGREKDYVELLKNGVRKIASAFKGKPVWIRCSDMRSDEYRNLTGGDKEPHETDPMIGWHGIRRLLDEEKILRAEFQAVRELHYEGWKNVGVMIPFVIRTEELRKAKEIMREVGLEPCVAVDFGVMVETPASCWIIEELCREGISFVSFGTNDLTQLTLGIDRNNERLADRFDEMHPAVLGEIARVVKTCKKYNVVTSICGQAGSRPKMAEFLVHQGIDSISANVDAVETIRHTVARVERKLMLEKRD